MKIIIMRGKRPGQEGGDEVVADTNVIEQAECILKEYRNKGCAIKTAEGDEVELNEIIGDVTTIFELHVAKDDVGKVIGKQGQTAQAIRTLLNATAIKLKKRAVLEIIE